MSCPSPVVAWGPQEGTAEPTHPAHSLRPAQTGGLGKGGKEPYDYSATNRSPLPASFAGVSLMAAARVYLHIPTADPEAVNAAPGSCRAYVEEMEADHGAGTAASGPCQPLKKSL